MAYETTNAAGVGTATQVVVGLFDKASNAHEAVTDLRANGFSSAQIGAAFRNAGATNVAGHDKENWWEKVKDAFRPEEDKVGTRKEAAAGATVSADPYARDEYEYDFAGDDFEDSLTGAGIAPARAAYLNRSLRAGGAIVTVRDTDRAAEAEQILSSNGGTVRYEDTSEIDAADSTGQADQSRGSQDPQRRSYGKSDHRSSRYPRRVGVGESSGFRKCARARGQHRQCRRDPCAPQ
jgi:hypothetical protein